MFRIIYFKAWNIWNNWSNLHHINISMTRGWAMLMLLLYAIEPIIIIIIIIIITINLTTKISPVSNPAHHSPGLKTLDTCIDHKRTHIYPSPNVPSISLTPSATPLHLLSVLMDGAFTPPCLPAPGRWNCLLNRPQHRVRANWDDHYYNCGSWKARLK